MAPGKNETNTPQAPASLMTIFGASGDLTKRLLLPSLYNLVATHVLPEGFRLLGVAKDNWDDAKFRDHIGTTLKEFWGPDADAEVVKWLQQRASYQQANFDEDAAFDTLKATIAKIEEEAKGGNRLFYLAVAPSFIAGITGQLGRTGLILEEGENGSWRRLVIEKPFGHDLQSAVQLNADLQQHLREDQIYRIDHFAGKEAVQDLSIFRFANAIFEPIWNRSFVDHVQITAAETVGVESRAGYYEHSGALRDMVPNHMAEMLSLVAMEPPVSFSAEHFRRKQVELLQSTRALKPEQVADYAVRGQYGAGTVAGKSVAAYRDEPGVDPHSMTETYVALKVEIDNWRWSGVPFYLRTGKRLTRALTEIVVTFRQPPACLFPGGPQGDASANRLVFQLQPNSGIQLHFGSKAPGLVSSVEYGEMNFQFPQGPFGEHGKGYERLLHDVMIGNPMLFQEADFVEAGWRLVQPLLDSWSAPTESFPNYASGSTGPDAADELLAKAGHCWHSLEQAATP